MKRFGWFVLILLGAVLTWKGRVIASGITQSAYNLIENAGSALFRRTTLNFTGSGISCADDGTNNRTTCTVSGSSGSFGGVNVQTGNYTLQASDSGLLVVMNCSSSCAATLYGSPTSTFSSAIISIGSTLATVSLNSLDYNGTASAPLLTTGQILYFGSNGTNYFGNMPFTASTNVAFTPGSNNVAVSATGGGSGSFSAAPPYYSNGTNYYVAATGYQATKPSSSPSWINSVVPTNTTAGTNGDYIFSGTGNYWAELSATTSVEAEFSTAAPNGNSGTGDPYGGIWVYDSTNSLIYFLGVGLNNGLGSFSFQSWTYSGSGNPAFSSTIHTYYSVIQGNAEHLKLVKSGSTLTAEVSLNGGVTFTTIATQSVGTISDAGYGMNSNSTFGVVDIFSLVVN